MNLDFSNDPTFSFYVLVLGFSGIAMLVMASPAFGRASIGVRLLNFAFGLGFVGYAFYLAFLFDGVSYVIFYQAFILPVVLIASTVRNVRATADAAAMATSGMPPTQSPAPGYGAPGQPPAAGYGPTGQVAPQPQSQPQGYASPAADASYSPTDGSYPPPVDGQPTAPPASSVLPQQ